MSLSDWLAPLVVGITFTFLGTMKLVGLRHGVVGGKDKPLADQIWGT